MQSRGVLVFLAFLSVLDSPLGGASTAHTVGASKGECRRVSFTGEVKTGAAYRRVIGSGLAVMLKPIASGWILRIAPVTGAAIEHDYAELATPPYNSVTPLSISTDFSFRAQDAIGWNPREFGFATNKGDYAKFLNAYRDLAAPGATPSPGAEREMVGLLSKAAHGRMRILDARLAPGTADQWRMAAAVASHFSTTAHTVDESGEPTPLGKILWMRFQIDLEAQASFAFDPSLRVASVPCEK